MYSHDVAGPNGLGTTYRQCDRENRLLMWRAATMVAATTMRTVTNGVGGHLRAMRAGRAWGMAARWRVGNYVLSPAGRATFERVDAALAIGDTIGALVAQLDVDGISIAKCAFALQLIGAPVGCWDTVNLERLGYGKLLVTMYKRVKKDADLRPVCAEYVALCDKHAGAAGMWDDWCTIIAGRRSGRRMGGPAGVSNAHIVWMQTAMAGIIDGTLTPPADKPTGAK